MSEDTLSKIDLSAHGESTTPSEAMDFFHNPDIAYYAIQAAAEIDGDFDVDIEGDVSEEEIRIRGKINVFQLVMQFAEAFGIYYLSYLKGREDLMKDLVTTRPKGVKRFFEAVQDGTEDEYLEKLGIEEQHEELMKYWFGYRFVEEDDRELEEVVNWEAFTAETVEELVEESVATLERDIRRIAGFYLQFEGIYNAVKHGDRVIIGAESEVSIAGEDGEQLDQFDDENFVGFVCREENDPFLVTLPIDYLYEDALLNASNIRQIFNYCKEVSESLIKEDDEDTELTVTFLERRENSEQEGTEWVKGSTEGGAMILPRTEELQNAVENPPSGTYYGRMELDGDILVIRTERGDEPSDEYPIEVTIRHGGSVRLSSDIRTDTQFSYNPSEIDVVQHAELFDIRDQLRGEGISQMRMVFVDEDVSVTSADFMGIDPDKIPTFVDSEYVRFLSLLQQISQRTIPTPLHLSEEQEALIVDNLGETSDMSQDEICELVHQLEKAGSDRAITAVWAELVTPAKEILARKQVLTFNGYYEFSATVADDEAIPQLKDDRIEVAPGNDTNLRLALRGYPVTYLGLVQQLENKEDTVIDELFDIFRRQNTSENSNAAPTLYIEYNTNEYGFWSSENLFRLQVIRWAQCPLCNEYLHTTLAQHLVNQCEPMP